MFTGTITVMDGMVGVSLRRIAVAVTFSVLVGLCAGRRSSGRSGDVDDERLPGWKGETYHSNLCWGKRSQCYGVNAVTARKANQYVLN